MGKHLYNLYIFSREELFFPWERVMQFLKYKSVVESKITFLEKRLVLQIKPKLEEM